MEGINRPKMAKTAILHNEARIVSDPRLVLHIPPKNGLQTGFGREANSPRISPFHHEPAIGDAGYVSEVFLQLALTDRLCWLLK